MNVKQAVTLRFKRTIYVALTMMASAVGYLQLRSGVVYAANNTPGKGQIVGGVYICDCTNGGGDCKCLT
jgi:hypothetical protein